MNFKQRTLLDWIRRIGEVTISDLDPPDQQRLKSLIEKGAVVESRTGCWSGEKYYKARS